jgi:hypothetical protein
LIHHLICSVQIIKELEPFEEVKHQAILGSGYTMSSTGNRIFRSTLLIESAANISAIFPMVLYPEYVLSWLVRGPAQITPAAKSLTQLFGGILVLATAPLLLSYPEPASGESASNVTARRRLSYLAMGATEATLGLVTLSQYLAGDSGMTDQALLTATATMVTFIGMRAFFLLAKPEFMEAQEITKKSQ